MTQETMPVLGPRLLLPENVEDPALGAPGIHQYRQESIDLSTARTLELRKFSGCSLFVSELNGSLQVAFNNADSPLITLREGEVYYVSFNQLFLSNPAQADADTCNLLAGTELATFETGNAAGRRPIMRHKTTGTGALALSTTQARRFKLVRVTVKFSAKPTTSEDVTLTLNSKDGADYDSVLARANPSTGSGTGDVVFTGTENDIYEDGDELDLAFTNTDGKTYGAIIVVEPV